MAGSKQQARNVRILDSSRRRTVVVNQESAESTPQIDSSAGTFRNGEWDNRAIPNSLMIAFQMIMFGVLAQRPTQHTRPDRNELGEAFLLDRSEEALGVGVHVRRSQWQPDHSDAFSFKRRSEFRRIFRVSIDDQVLLVT